MSTTLSPPARRPTRPDAAVGRLPVEIRRLPVGFFRTLPDGTLVAANAALAAMMEVTDPGELIGRAVTDFYARPDRRSNLLHRVHRDGDAATALLRFQNVHHERGWAYVHTIAVRDGAGRIAHYEGCIEDVTQHEETTRALRESEARLRFLFEHAPVHILEVDRNARILRSNHPPPGMTRAQMRGTSLYDWTPPALHGTAKAVLARVMNAGEPGEYEVEAPDDAGRPRIWACRVAPLHEGGGIRGALIIATDITDTRPDQPARAPLPGHPPAHAPNPTRPATAHAGSKAPGADADHVPDDA